MKHDVIEQLYHGGICPSEKTFERNSQYAEAMQRLTDAESYLRSILDREDREAFDTLTAAQREIDSITAMESFRDGFRLGVQLILASCGDNETPPAPSIE